MKYCIDCLSAMNEIHYNNGTVTYECPKCWLRISADSDGIYNRLNHPYSKNIWSELTKEELAKFERGVWNVS